MDRRKDLDRANSLVPIPDERTALIVTRDGPEFIRANYGMEVRKPDSLDPKDSASVEEFAKAHDPDWVLYRGSDEALTEGARERWLDHLFQPRWEWSMSFRTDGGSGLRVFHYGRCYWRPPNFNYFVEMPYRPTEKEKRAMKARPGWIRQCLETLGVLTLAVAVEVLIIYYTR
jgi:hypothetical protein